MRCPSEPSKIHQVEKPGTRPPVFFKYHPPHPSLPLYCLSFSCFLIFLQRSLLLLLLLLRLPLMPLALSFRSSSFTCLPRVIYSNNLGGGGINIYCPVFAQTLFSWPRSKHEDGIAVPGPRHFGPIFMKVYKSEPQKEVYIYSQVSWPFVPMLVSYCRGGQGGGGWGAEIQVSNEEPMLLNVSSKNTQGRLDASLSLTGRSVKGNNRSSTTI